MLEPYEWMGAGFAIDGDRIVEILVLAHDDASSAETNATRLRATLSEGASQATGITWSEVFAAFETEAVGRLTVAVLEPDGPGRELLEALLRQDSLLWCCG